MKSFELLDYWYFNHAHCETSDYLLNKAFEKLYLGFEYARDVVDGKKVCCELTVLACKRTLNDFERCDYGDSIRFNFDEALDVILFYCDKIKHVKGKLSGKTVDMMDFHAFILVSLFGWQKPQWKDDPETGELVLDMCGNRIPILNDLGEQNWVRRFNTAYVEVARKNAKSFLASGIGLYMTGYDGEGGAEVYSAATTKNQARIVFNDAKEMINKSPKLKKALAHHKLNIHDNSTASKFEPLSSDANTLDGLNIHCGIVDELHAHKTRDVWDVLETATGAREQPLILAITTSGTILDGICMEQRDYSEKILKGLIDDDSYFAIIYTLDEDDDPYDESVWFKANPALGIAKKWDDLRRLAKKAKEQTSARANFLTKHMNIWVRGANSWIDAEKWEALTPEYSEPSDPTWVSIDLSAKIDITASIKVRKTSDSHVHLQCKFWLPEGRLLQCSKQMAQLYKKWADSGHLELIDGDVIDQEIIKEDVIEWLSGDNIQELPYDPWKATQIALDFQKKGLPVVEVPQSTKNLSEAMREVEAAIYSGTIHHDSNPVMLWMMSNVMVKPDKNDNIFPLKERAENKIDGPVALFTCMSRVILGGIDNKCGLDFWDEDEEIICF